MPTVTAFDGEKPFSRPFEREEKPQAAAFDLRAQDAAIEQETRVKASLRAFSERDPDAFAKALKESQKTGFSIDVMADILPQVEKERETHDFLSLRQENPGLFNWLDSSPDNVGIARDDTDSLSKIERATRKVDPEAIGNLSGWQWTKKAVGGAFSHGQDTTRLAELRALEAKGTATPEQIIETDRLSASVNQQRRFAADGFMQESAVETARQLPTLIRTTLAGAEGAVYGGAAGAATGAAVGAAGGVPLGGVGAAPGALAGGVTGLGLGARTGFAAGAALESFDQQMGLAFDEFKGFRDATGQPLDPGTARAAAGVAGLINAGMEVTGLSAVLKTIPGVDRLVSEGGTEAVRRAMQSPTVMAAFKNAGLKFTKGVAIESLTEVAQELVVITAGELAAKHDGLKSDGYADLGNRLAQTLEQTVKGVWMLPAAGSGASFIHDSARAARASQNTKRMQALGEGAKASKLLQRMPEKFREAVATMKKDGDIDNVYLDAQNVAQLFQADGLDGAEVFRELMGDEGVKRFAEALETGGRIEVPLEVYTEKLAGSELHDRLTDHAAFEADGMTPFEGRAFDQERDATLSAIYEGMQRPVDDAANPVFEDTVSELLGVGFSQKDAEDQAQFRVGLFRGLGQRAGLTAEQFLSRFPLSVKRPQNPAFQAKQPGDLDPYLEALRANNFGSDVDLFGRRLITDIIRLGGINPDSEGVGDLRRIIDKEKRPGLISSKGMPLEYMAQALAENGWLTNFETTDEFGRPDWRELLELIRDDLIGEVRQAGGGDEGKRQFKEQADLIAEELSQLGISLDLPNDEIARRLDQTVRLEQADREIAAFDTDGDPSADQLAEAKRQREAVEQTNAEVLRAHREEGKPLPAPNGKPSNLTEHQWIQVRTENFKNWFGEWEGLQKQVELDALVDRAAQEADPSGKVVLREATPEEVAEILRQGGPDVSGMVHEITAEELRHALKRHGQPDEATRQPGQRPLTVDDLRNIATVIDAPTEITVQPRGKNRTSIVYGRDFGDGTVEYVERVFETSQRNKPRLTTRTVWVRDAATGVKSSPTRVSAPYRNSSVLFADGRVNQDTVSKAVDANGEPLVVYHGTNANFEAFDDAKRGESTRATSSAAGFFFSDDARTGQSYADYAAIFSPVTRLTEDANKLADKGDWDAYDAKIDEAERLENDINSGDGRNRGQNLISGFLSLSNPLVFDAEGEVPDGIGGINNLIRKAQKGGHDGIIIKNFDDAAMLSNRVSDHYVAFDPNQIKSAIGNRGTFSPDDSRLLFQKKGKDPRGAITGALPGDRDGDTREFNISLFKKADLTTFTHETGHMAFAMLADLAADARTLDTRTAEQDRIIADFDKLLEWTGAESFESMTVPQLEQVARGFEAYIMEGKAPAPELKSVFARVRTFMLAIYKSLKGLNVELTDDVRNVFDRLLASETEIQFMREADAAEKLFDVDQLKALGATDAEIEAYQRVTQDDQDEALNRLTPKVMRPILERRKDTFRDLRKTVEAEVKADVEDDPVYRAIDALSGRKVPDDLDGVLRALDKESLLEQYGQAWLSKNLKAKRVYRVEGGMNPSIAAQLLGFNSADEMVKAIAAAPKKADYIKAETERRLEQIIPDPMRDGSISDEVRDALHNHRRGDVLAMELKMLDRRAGGNSPTTRQVAKGLAERIIADQTVKDIQPHRYQLAEKKAAKAAINAAISGDYKTAAEAKRQELLNFYLWRVATDAKAEAEKARVFLTKQTKKPARERRAKAGPEYVAQADALLAAYGFGLTPVSPANVRDWVRLQEESGYETAIPEEVIRRAESGPANWRNVSMAELRGVRDSLININHLAKLSREVIGDGKKVEWEQAKAELEAKLRDTTKARKRPFTEAEATLLESAYKASKDWMDGILRPETIVEWMDGGESGPWHTYFWDQAEASQNARYDLREETLKPLVDMLGKWNRKDRERMAEPIEVKALGLTMHRSTLISMAMNMGNQSNLDKLMRGGFMWDGKHHPFTAGAIAEIQGHLSDADWIMVQNLWDTVDQLWPKMKTFIEDMGGLPPSKVEAVAFQTPTGRQMRGGYWPVVYDRKQSAIGAKQEASAALSDAMGGITRATTKKGSQKERTGVARPMLLEFENILNRHVDEVITDLTHRRFVLQANKILLDDELSDLIRNRMGDAAFESLKGMVSHTISDRQYFDPSLAAQSNLMNAFVSNTSVAALGFKVATAIGNLVVAPIQASARVNPAHMVPALAQFMTSPVKTFEYVNSLSPMMRHRTQNLDQSYREVIRYFRGKKDLRGQVARIAMSVHRYADIVGSTVVWLAKVRQERAKGTALDQAVKLADKAIRQTQTAGAPKDLSSFERSPHFRMFRMFIGPMIIMNNRMREAVRFKGNVQNVPEALGTLFATWFVPALMFEIAVGRGPEEDDEPWQWAMAKLAVYPMGTLPYFRDVASVAEAEILGGLGFSRMNPMAEGGKMLVQATANVVDAFTDGEDVDEQQLTKSMLRAAGPLTGLPTGQITLTGDYIFDVLTGEYDPEGIADARYLIYRRPKE